MNNQTQRILDYCRVTGSITAQEAMLHLGVMRLASRVADLKKAGYTVSREMVTVRNRYNEPCRVARYTITEG